MASTTEGDELFFQVASQLAARLPVMDLEIFATSASLASPAITPEHLLAEPPVGSQVQANSGSSGHGPRSRRLRYAQQELLPL